ncbi:MAG TPA: PQQ-dependent sugar dehydrogenase [Acidimicrobiales bacterium]|nr:PQQ-dependent sugar dehydrogenase [Acidimicrobiales bacterium]
MRGALFAVVGLVLLAGCARDGSGGSGGAPTTTSTTTASTTTAAPTTTTTRPAAKGVKLTQVASFDQPVAMAVRGDQFYVAEKTGRVRPLAGGGGPVIDVSGNLSLGSEQGLLGLAFSPDGRSAYVNYTDRAGDTHIAEHDMSAGPTALKDILFVDQPFPNHNGGQLAFGPDGLLYAGLGDGGSQHDPRNNGQNPNVVLGKILRFRLPDTKPEVFALGLRNPWRFSFDRAGGDLWIGDVGQNQWEEVDVDRAPVDAGRNYGWSRREGRHREKGDPPPGAVEPEYEYSHAGGNCSVIAGYVYRGSALRAVLDGKLLFADYCAGDLMALRDGKAEDLHLHVDAVTSFGQDAAGEVYVLSQRGPVYRLDAVL